MNDPHNRRNATRFPSEFSVEYLGNQFLGRGTVLNLSPNGVLIRGDYLPIVGTRVSLRMVPPDGQGKLFVERAVVRWVGNSQLGVEIVAMTSVAYMRLASLMAAILRERGCVCTPLLPWHCRCPNVPPAAKQGRGPAGTDADLLPKRQSDAGSLMEQDSVMRRIGAG
jgi:hypothetical protein